MYKNILLPLDISNIKTQKKAVDTAIDFAKNFDSTLHILTVIPDFGMSIVGGYFPENYEKNMIKDATATLSDYVEKNIPEEIRQKKIVAHGSIYDEILDYAGKTKVNLIVMASHRPEVKDYLVGPNASRVVRHANCSVMVVRP